MIRSLKTKIIAVNMIIVVLIMASAMAILYFNTYSRYYRASIGAMKDAVSYPFDFDSRFDVGKKRNRNAPTVFYVVIDENGESNALIGNRITVNDDDKFRNMIKACLSSGKDIGTVKSENLRYMVTNSKYFGKVIAFADMSGENEMLSQIKKNFFIIGSAVLAAALVFSIIFAAWVANPVKRAMQKQSRFVADASHELKTPLTVILANAELINPSDGDAESREKYIANIKTEASRMNLLVCDMLTLAKADESAHIKTEKTLVNVSDTVTAVAMTFEPVAYEQGKTFIYDIAPELCTTASAKDVERLVTVLIDNALKYANIGGEVDIFLYKNGSRFDLSVRNSGEPIPKERLSHLFDRFYRPDDARARQTGGFGLGLAIAKEIAVKNGIKLSVESNADIGTVFNASFKQKEKG